MQLISSLFRTGLFIAGLTAVNDAHCETYYVAIDGSDSYEGTITSPFATISKAISQVVPGDTVYVMKGNYLLTNTIQINSSSSGTAEDTCRLWAFPGDTIVLDFFQQAFGSRGITLQGDYWHIRGIKVKNAGDNGLYINGGHNLIENCTFQGNDDTGLQISGGGSYNTIVNCDSYFNVDPDNEDADGFAAKLDIGPGNEFHGCRSWNNADDGWDLYESDDSVAITNCWAFYNGYLPQGNPSTGDGNGFKLGGNYIVGNHLVENCISFNNRKYGYHQNNNTGAITIYNSLGWDNDKQNFNFYLDEADTSVLVNNISFSTGADDKFIKCIVKTNSWQVGGANANDFISLDRNLAKDARQPDGKLPANNFGRLQLGSNLIDAGTDIGIDYSGASPDLGPFELLSTSVAYSLIIQTEGEGGVWISPSGGLYEDGQEVLLVVWSGEGYRFQGWGGDTSGKENSILLVMNSDKNIIATFTESNNINTDSLRFEAENMIYSTYVFERLEGASNGKIIRASSAASFDQATISFEGDSNNYNVHVRYYDQDDGASTYKLSVNNSLLDEWQGDSAPDGINVYIGHTIKNVALTTGDEIKIESNCEGTEYGGVDCFDLVKNELIPEAISDDQLTSRERLYQNFPNPFNQSTNIRFYLEKASVIKLGLADMLGKNYALVADIRYSEGMHSYLLDASGLPSGIYCCYLFTGDHSFYNYLVIM